MKWTKEGIWYKLKLSDTFVICVPSRDATDLNEVCFVCPLLKTPVWITLNNKLNTLEEIKKEALQTVFEYMNKVYITTKKFKQLLKPYL